MDKNIYDLKLHETTKVKTGYNEYIVTRVPGGWLYKVNRLDANAMTVTFVSFNNEFMSNS